MSVGFASDRPFGRMRVMAMSGWQTLVWSGVCATGALAFLKMVANDLERSQHSLHDFEEMQRREQRRRIGQQQEDVVTLEAASDA